MDRKKRKSPVWIQPLKTSLKIGIDAAYRSRYAGIALWMFGCSIILGYYLVPPVQGVLDQIGELKNRFGFLFSAISTALFGGLFPSLLHRWVDRHKREKPAHLVSNTLFWAFKGIEVDALYRCQAWMFGDELDWPTITLKTLFDQIIYAPCWGLTTVVVFYLWRDCGYRFRDLQQRLNGEWLRLKLMPSLVTNWLLWIPAVILIYNMPLALQLPVQNLILCFWVLVLTILSSGSADR